ncbi:MAG TPA: tetratricopeptide repeat protein [Magnetospirillaceae bacterium]|nr:tetratricopeptide repeat protein [Magnetospirillaceae bacterium]
MAPAVPVLIAILLIALTALALGLALGRGGRRAGGRLKTRDRSQILKEADRRLASNPRDADALLALGDIYWGEKDWPNVFRTYGTLAELAAARSDLDGFTINARYGIAAVHTDKTEEAYKGLLLARTYRQDDFEVNFRLGILEFHKRQYEKSQGLLLQAARTRPDNAQALRHLGHAQFKTRRFLEALASLRRATELEPEDKESLFVMGECFYELGQNAQAIRVFSLLRSDPRLGPNASLFSGTLHLNTRQIQKAILDFEIGLRHPEVPVETLVELKYRLAAAYIRSQEISKAVAVLSEIQSIQPGYKDVPAQLAKCTELNTNRNLQTFLMGGTDEFANLCRRVVFSFFPRAKVKIVDLAVNRSDSADVLAEVETARWQDVILFRFIRSTGTVGELAVRDFHARMKDVKAGKGYCVSAGNFTDEAHRFVEARLLDLLDKDKLIRLLKAIDPEVANAPSI